MTKYKPEIMWAFAWAREQPYITAMISFTRNGCILEVERWIGQPWKKTYRQGGRIIKVKVSQVK